MLAASSPKMGSYDMRALFVIPHGDGRGPPPTLPRPRPHFKCATGISALRNLAGMTYFSNISFAATQILPMALLSLCFARYLLFASSLPCFFFLLHMSAGSQGLRTPAPINFCVTYQSPLYMIQKVSEDVPGKDVRPENATGNPKRKRLFKGYRIFFDELLRVGFPH